MAQATQQTQITVTLVLDEDEASWLKAVLQNPLASIPVQPHPGDDPMKPLSTLPALPEYEDERDHRCRLSIFKALRFIV